MRNPIPAMRDTAMAYDLMPPVRAGGPRSELAGPMNDAQSAQMAELMGRPPQGGQASPYPATASLDQGAGVNPMRNSITQALMTAQGVPQPNPTIGAATPPTTPVDTGIRAAPPVQLAQNGPAPGIPQINRVTPPVTMPGPGPVPDQPASEPMNQAEIQGLRLKQMGIQRQDPAMTAQGDLLIQKGKEARDKQDADNKAAWEAKIITERQRRDAQEAAERGAPLVQQQLDKAKAEADVARAGAIITKNTGLPPQVVMEDFKARQPAADRDVSLLRNARLAKQMIETGVVSGVGANLRVDLARARALWGNIPESELASRSERALAATKAMVGYGLNQYQPGDTRVTNSDTIVSGQIVGGDASQQLQTRKELVNMVLQDSNRRIADYEQRHDTAFKGTPAAELYRLRTDPIHDDPAIAKGALDILLKPENVNDPYVRQKFDARFGPGSAELEIARAERRNRGGR